MAGVGGHPPDRTGRGLAGSLVVWLIDLPRFPYFATQSGDPVSIPQKIPSTRDTPAARNPGLQNFDFGPPSCSYNFTGYKTSGTRFPEPKFFWFLPPRFPQ